MKWYCNLFRDKKMVRDLRVGQKNNQCTCTVLARLAPLYIHEIGNQCGVKPMVQPDSGLSKYVMSVQKKSALYYWSGLVQLS